MGSSGRACNMIARSARGLLILLSLSRTHVVEAALCCNAFCWLHLRQCCKGYSGRVFVLLLGVAIRGGELALLEPVTHRLVKER